jgi:hypothetical protein
MSEHGFGRKAAPTASQRVRREAATAAKREAAKDRQDARNKLSDEQQLAEIAARPGNSARETARLQARIAARANQPQKTKQAETPEQNGQASESKPAKVPGRKGKQGKK